MQWIFATHPLLRVVISQRATFTESVLQFFKICSSLISLLSQKDNRSCFLNHVHKSFFESVIRFLLQLHIGLIDYQDNKNYHFRAKSKDGFRCKSAPTYLDGCISFYLFECFLCGFLGCIRDKHTCIATDFIYIISVIFLF